MHTKTKVNGYNNIETVLAHESFFRGLFIDKYLYGFKVSKPHISNSPQNYRVINTIPNVV